MAKIKSVRVTIPSTANRLKFTMSVPFLDDKISSHSHMPALTTGNQEGYPIEGPQHGLWGEWNDVVPLFLGAQTRITNQPLNG